jgi:hypothetical protein
VPLLNQENKENQLEVKPRQISALGWDTAGNKKKISNIEQGISKAEAIGQIKITSSFDILCSIFDIPSGWQVYVSELPAAEELAKQLPFSLLQVEDDSHAVLEAHAIGACSRRTR